MFYMRTVRVLLLLNAIFASTGASAFQCEKLLTEINAEHQKFIEDSVDWMKDVGKTIFSLEEGRDKYRVQLENYTKSLNQEEVVALIKNFHIFIRDPKFLEVSVEEQGFYDGFARVFLGMFSAQQKLLSIIPLMECAESNEKQRVSLLHLYKPYLIAEAKNNAEGKLVGVPNLDPSFELLKSTYKQESYAHVLLSFMLEVDEARTVYTIINEYPEFAQYKLLIQKDISPKIELKDYECLKTFLASQPKEGSGYEELVKLTESDNKVISKVALTLKGIYPASVQ